MDSHELVDQQLDPGADVDPERAGVDTAEVLVDAPRLDSPGPRDHVHLDTPGGGDPFVDPVDT
ncbi:hypothetical protein JNO54_14005 [Janibacter sp. YIM B02568]|uniref:hypothetical protein n=1 Tax=Janibacter endophyticus TaxID=2806261 RepID=UPI0019523EDE|nr:hypothetical protein [Janibacter endophyticus]MBM6547246.1 hypothetical protein [Janibacter endophyticus]